MGGARSCRILAGYGVDVAGFIISTDGAVVVGENAPDMGGTESFEAPFVLECHAYF